MDLIVLGTKILGTRLTLLKLLCIAMNLTIESSAHSYTHIIYVREHIRFHTHCIVVLSTRERERDFEKKKKL